MDRSRPRTLRPLALAALLPLAGCSFVALGPPRASDDPAEPVRCSTSRVAPALDGVAAGALTLFSLWVAMLSNGLCDALGGTDCGTPPEAMAGFAAAGAYFASTGYGVHRANECQAAKAARRCDPLTGMNCPLGLPPGTAPAAAAAAVAARAGAGR